MMYKTTFVGVTLAIAIVAIMVPYLRGATIPRNLKMFPIEQGLAYFFPRTVQEMQQRYDAYLQDVQEQIKSFKAVPHAERTFANTAQAFDAFTGSSDLVMFAHALAVIKYLHPHDELRAAAEKMLSAISAFFVDVTSDKEVYRIFKKYIEGRATQEDLSPEQRYYLQESMKDFIRMGLELPDEQLEEIKKLQKELVDLGILFGKNISTDNRTIEATLEQLKGLPEDFIASLKRAENGNYILGMDYPTVFTVLDKADDADTRKRIWIAFSNRAYPANDQVLKDLIARRDELAHKLGFATFAHLALDDQMVGTPERAATFIANIAKRSNDKEQLEHELFSQDLPASVVLDEQGKFYPWDISYTIQSYRKKHFDLDEEKIAEYFPVAKTIEGLFAIYQELLSLRFQEVPVSGLWSDELRMLQVYDAQTNNLLGYVLLDLHPRDNKFSHAGQLGIIPALITPQGESAPALSVIMANFPNAQGDKPALFKRADVKTFFHEFGHALHALLGRTHLAAFSGTSVKTDFVELPSQMLEEWLFDKDMLKKVSAHYQTGQPLPDETIDKILALKNLSVGGAVQRQCMLAKLSLDYYGLGRDKDVNALYAQIRTGMVPNIVYMPEDHMFASFGHLSGYNAKYYGYLWSKVFALDLFSEFKKVGLLNPTIGKRYVDTVLSRGGSADPNELLRDFLGREPNDQAFFEDMGL